MLTLASAAALVVAAQQAFTTRVEAGRAENLLVEARRDLGALRDRLKRMSVRPGPDRVALVRARAATMAPPSQVLRDLIDLMPPGVRFDSLEMTYGPEVEIQALVVALAVGDYDEFMERLARSGRFASIEPGPEERGADMRANLRAVYRVRTGP